MPRTSESTLAAIKQAIDIVALVGDYLPLTRSGSKYKVLCPFHDDHHPSMELNPDRQSFKCWVCGAGGDVFDFVKGIERVEFPEALRMLADRAGIALDAPTAAEAAPGGISKTELLAVNAWAERAYVDALGRSEPAREYLASRRITRESIEKFVLGYAPGERGWLLAKAKKEGFPVDLLEKAGLVVRPADTPGQVRERFRGRLIFPIHDPRGRAIGFGGRVLPDVEKLLAAAGKRVAKYLNSPETPLFKKRQVLYAGDLARAAARDEKAVAVVEGYTDVIAAHQVGLCNVVGTLGTALGDDHVVALRRLADRVILIFDGDDAGQKAADRSLEIFLSHELDVRVLTLPENLDPCDFLLKEGAGAFRALIGKAVDPLEFFIRRAEEKFDFASIEGSRLAASWLLQLLVNVPVVGRVGLDIKVGKILNTLADRLRIHRDTVVNQYREFERAKKSKSRLDRLDQSPAVLEIDSRPLHPLDLDVLDRELLQIVLSEPAATSQVIHRISVCSLRDPSSRSILQACYDLYGEGQSTTFERVSLRLNDSKLRSLAAGLLLPFDPHPLAGGIEPADWNDRLNKLLVMLAERDRQERMRDLKAALDETNPTEDPDGHRALLTEYLRLLNRRPDTKKKNAS